MQDVPTIGDLWKIPGGPGSPKRQTSFANLALQFRGIGDLNRLIKSKLCAVSGKYDVIMGIPRSGLLVANLVALYLNLPLAYPDQLKDINHSSLRTSRRSLPSARRPPDSPLRVLVVEDSSNSGESLRKARQMMAEHPPALNWQVHYLAAYVTRESLPGTDLHFEVLEQPRIFEWNFMHHVHAQNYLFDLDGVLCEDGPTESSDHMDAYLEHLENARPKIIPSLKIGAIVTSRLEKYRRHTENWLKKHKVIYEHLIMINLASAEERRRLALHGRFKADVYNTLGGALFVESEAWQAKEIAAITGKAVYNLEDNEFIRAAG